MAKQIQIRRAYEAPDANDGYRVFIDRLWPRGLSKDDFKFDYWCKDLAPSSALRTWFGHRIERWDGFQENYRQELRAPELRELMHKIAEQTDKATITLVYGAKDGAHNNAVVLADEMSRELKRKHR